MKPCHVLEVTKAETRSAHLRAVARANSVLGCSQAAAAELNLTNKNATRNFCLILWGGTHRNKLKNKEKQAASSKEVQEQAGLPREVHPQYGGSQTPCGSDH